MKPDAEIVKKDIEDVMAERLMPGDIEAWKKGLITQNLQMLYDEFGPFELWTFSQETIVRRIP